MSDTGDKISDGINTFVVALAKRRISSVDTGDKISDGLDTASDLTNALSEAGIKTGKAGFWLRLSASLARIGSALFGRKR